jgi:hypothetical protein
MMETRTVVGLTPWLPWPLSRWPWWTEPVRAERLAAFRIGVAIVLLLDILGTYWPKAPDFFGANSLSSPDVFGETARALGRWSLLRGNDDPLLVQGVLVLWTCTAVFLLLGWLPRLSAALAWILSISIFSVNLYLHNAGDNVRAIALFYLMLSPCGAVWSWPGWVGRIANPSYQRVPPPSGPVYVPAWSLRLLFVQMVIIYFFNGVYKLAGPNWREGDILHYVLGNLAWTRFSYAQVPLPYPLLQALAWGTLAWELAFPLLVFSPRTRALALWMGVGFHLGTGSLLQLGPFPLYMMCLYLPLVPWERYIDT